MLQHCRFLKGNFSGGAGRLRIWPNFIFILTRSCKKTFLQYGQTNIIKLISKRKHFLLWVEGGAGGLAIEHMAKFHLYIDWTIWKMTFLQYGPANIKH